MKYIPRQPDRNVNVTPTSPLRDFLVMLTGAALIFVAVYFMLGLLVDLLVPRISPETEELLGTLFAGNEPAKMPPSSETVYLQGLADQIQNKCVDLPYDLQVAVIENDSINALALPGGRIVVFSGLLEKARSENELAFVLAHEMGHFAGKDHLSGLGRSLIFMTLSVSVFGTDSAVGRKIGQLLEVSELSFSRKHEVMADTFALQTVNCFYGHVAGVSDFFEHTAEMEDVFFAGHYLSTHPLGEERTARLYELAGERGYALQGELVPFAGSELSRASKGKI